jgi:arthrofactin-type cyclic lipopeptide synthetase C
VVGGEKAERRLLTRWRQRTAGHYLGWLNTYGPTETTVYSAALLLKANDEVDTHDIPIGRPIANTQMYILDAHQQPVPIGVAGELYIGGAGVARGYLNRPELTAQRFVRDPFSSQPQARMYRTGDLARFRPDGHIEYLGRNDHQVKIRGFRIELGEIEARLASHPSVRQTVVQAREDQPGDKRLVAYFTAHEPAPDGASASPEIEALRTHLSAVLPDYMVPAAYVRLDHMPLTPNGKLDRKALPAPEAGAYLTRDYQPPLGEVETTVARIWAEVLKLERVGRTDNFFALGGHSLLTVKVTSQLRESGKDASVADLFNHPTLESFARCLSGASSKAELRGALRVREGTQTPLFLVHDGYGDELYFSVLAQCLPEEVPVYGLPSVRSGEAPPPTLQHMASRLVAMIREVQKTGPYRVGGWSFGGVLAYEIAQQLLEDGQTLEFLGMLDAFCPDDSDKENLPQSPEALLVALCEEKRTYESRGTATAQRLGVPDINIGFDGLFDHYRDSGSLPENLAHLSSSEALAQCRKVDIYWRAMTNYRPQPIQTLVHLFVAAERPPGWPALTESLGWEDVVPAHLLCTRTVPGTHHSMMQPPHIKELGKQLAESLSAAGDMKVCP